LTPLSQVDFIMPENANESPENVFCKECWGDYRQAES
jgi:hypothetical protein